MRDSAAPIGLFDSGVGGLTVLNRITLRMPQERFLYIADQAHVPYGGRPLAEIRGFAEAMTAHLLEAGAKAVVMACNISSAVALPGARELHGPHVMGVIEPGARAALAQTTSGRVGVLATEGTVKSGAYTQVLEQLDPNVQVLEVACPAFVPLIEAGAQQSPQAHEAARQALAPLASVDTVILGCTHYPFMLPALRRVAERPLSFIDPAEQTAIELEQQLGAQGLRAQRPGQENLLLTTGALDRFEAQARAFVQLPQARFEGLRWPLGAARQGRPDHISSSYVS